jgi:putative transcriptional regulator
MPGMGDHNFGGSVVFIAEHSAKGALGLVINRPMELDLGTLFERIDLRLAGGSLARSPVFYGGPVQTDRGFVLHRPSGAWQSTLNVGDDIALTSSRDILQTMSETGEPHEVLITLGYSGWSAGQLEWELAQNAWLTVAAKPRIIFDLPPEERLPAAMQLLGVDFTNLSDVAGHA